MTKIKQYADPDNDSVFFYKEVVEPRILAKMVFTDKPGDIEIKPIKVFIGNIELASFTDWEDAEKYISRTLGMEVV